MANELDFIQRLRQQCVVRAPVTTGIGDDGAVLSNPDGSQTVVVTDMLLDGVHFDLRQSGAALAGRKAVAVNLSDLAALGCRPTAAFVSIAVPDLSQSDEFLQELYAGMADLADSYEFTIAGGDTNSWTGPFAINVCLTGVPFASQAVLRSGAQPGDVLAVTGPLGGSLASGRHLSFEPQLRTAEVLVRHTAVHAMMDISDGLAIDLHRLAAGSATGAVLQSAQIPIHSDVPTTRTSTERLASALSDGEDFELLVALSPESLPTAQRALREADCRPLVEIGRITGERGCRLVENGGTVCELSITGWQH